MGFVQQWCNECHLHYEWDMYEESDCPKCAEPIRCCECRKPVYEDYVVVSPTGDPYLETRDFCKCDPMDLVEF